MKRIIIEVEENKLPHLEHGEQLNVEVDAWGPAFEATFVKEYNEPDGWEDPENCDPVADVERWTQLYHYVPLQLVTKEEAEHQAISYLLDQESTE